MYPQILSRLIFPALDLLNRTRIGQILRFLERAESFSIHELRDLQDRKLERLLRYVGENSSFYREHWRKAPPESRARSLHPQLDGVPVVTKRDLRGCLGSFPVPAFRGRTLRINTSGSTGTPTTFLRSVEQESWFWSLRLRMWRWAGFQLGEPYMAINLNPRVAWKKRVQDLFLRCTYVTYNADTINSERILDLLDSGKIVHINAFGSTLLALAHYMKVHGIQNPGVRILTSTGDNLFRPQRALIESAFGIGVTDYYGAGGEGMHLASQCEYRDGYHIHMENSVVEILKEGRPAQPREVGNIVVTQLDNYAMPLVRYDLGDLATPADDKLCPCGRSHPMLQSILGRACDIVFTPSGSALLPQFFFIGSFKTLEGVARYQVIQEELERILIRLVPEEGCDRRRCETSLRRYLDGATGRSLEVDFEWVPEIALAGLGKPRAVVSKLSTPGSSPSHVPPRLN